MRSRGSPSTANITRLAFGAALPLYAILAIVLPRAGVPATTYGSVSLVARVADLAAGLGMLLAAIVAGTYPQRTKTALLAAAAGMLWFGADWEGWSGGPSLVRSLGAMAPPLLLAVLFHLSLAFPNGRLQGRTARTAVTAVYAAAVVVAVGRALVRDPFLDPYCWRDCLDNAFLVHASPRAARVFYDLWLVCTLVVGLAMCGLGLRRLLGASRAGRRSLWPGLGAGALVGLSVVAGSTALAWNGLEGPRSILFRSLFVALAVSVLALAAAVCWSVIVARRRRQAIRRVTADLASAPQPGLLEEMLAAAVGDPTLEVYYPLEEPDRLVDGAGCDAELRQLARGRAVTPLTRSGTPVALVVHDESIEAADLAREIGAALRLAVENERLQAELLAQLDALRASRARIVSAGDAARRRLERNLHDGAQQRMLALTHQLRLARADAERLGKEELAAVLAESASEADAALDDLRRIAHGIYPAVLTEAGLEPALVTLADTAPLPVELALHTGARYLEPVEAAAYVTALVAIEDAAARDAGFVALDTRQEDNELVITVTDDGSPRSAPPIEISDRVGAVGGSVDVHSSSLRARLPCG